MTETDARAVLLLSACERAGLMASGDADAAGRESRRRLGAGATQEAWLGARAQLALDTLAQRQPGWQRALQTARGDRGGRWLLALVLGLLALAVGFGVLGDGLGASGRINLLSVPLLGLLGWNLGVYGLLLVQALLRWRPGAAATAGGWLSAAALWALTRLQAAWARWLQGPLPAAAAGAPGSLAAALARFSADWLMLSRGLQARRVAALLHAAAAMVGLGALLALYVRGLTADYQAGWDSTFLGPAQVRAVLGAVLGPASAVAGLPLPDAAALAGLRLSAGGSESAAPWIHRWALTLLGAVVLPRGVLAVRAGWRARLMARRLPPAQVAALADLADLQRLHQAPGADAAPRAVAVLPCSYTLDAARQAALPGALAGWLGHAVHCTLQPTLPLGAEDHPDGWLPGLLQTLRAAAATLPGATDSSSAVGHGAASAAPARESVLVLLFALTATPEADSHGALVQAVAQALSAAPAPWARSGDTPRVRLRVAVDQSGFRQRLAGADAPQRLAQRQAAWTAMLAGKGQQPGFIDLGT